MNQGCQGPCSKEAGEGLWLSLDAGYPTDGQLGNAQLVFPLQTLHGAGVPRCSGVIWHQIQHCAQTLDEHHKK